MHDVRIQGSYVSYSPSSSPTTIIGVMLNTLCILYCLIFQYLNRGKFCYLYFTDEESVALLGKFLKVTELKLKFESVWYQNYSTIRLLHTQSFLMQRNVVEVTWSLSGLFHLSLPVFPPLLTCICLTELCFFLVTCSLLLSFSAGLLN